MLSSSRRHFVLFSWDWGRSEGCDSKPAKAPALFRALFVPVGLGAVPPRKAVASSGDFVHSFILACGPLAARSRRRERWPSELARIGRICDSKEWRHGRQGAAFAEG